MKILIPTAVIFLYSTLVYLYLIKKTGIRYRFLFIDNILVGTVTLIVIILALFTINNPVPTYLAIIFLVPGLAFLLTMIRFWRIPVRRSNEDQGCILSPADGKIIYIRRIISAEKAFSVKRGRISKLRELTGTDLLQFPCWLIGINMTPFDVHKNAAPVSGRIIFNKHIKGKFLSLKNHDSETENERHSLVIRNEKVSIGVVQIASRLVRRIDNYVEIGQHINRGEWYGMIRFGSQVDLIIPSDLGLEIKTGTQVFAGKTIIARPENENID